MKTTLQMLTLCLVTATATANVSPVSGIYWNEDESGRGYSLDYQNGSLAVASYVYDNAGNPVWFLAAGPMNGDRFTADALVFENGQCISCPYVPPTVAETIGTLRLAFSSPDRARLTLNDLAIDIERQNFAFGAPPRSMLGQWVFLREVVVGFTLNTDYVFTTTGPPTGFAPSAGTFIDIDANAVGECFTSGTFADMCLLADLAGTGELMRAYVFEQRLDRVYGFEVDSQTLEPTDPLMGLQVRTLAQYSDADRFTARQANPSTSALYDALRTLYDAVDPGYTDN